MDEISLGDMTLTKYGMLYLDDYETAVIADLHIGYEDVMAGKGLFLPHVQKRYLLNMFDRIFEQYAPKTLVIDGDLKHEFSKNMAQEWREIEEVLEYLTARTRVIVVRGNHDNYLSIILKRKGMQLHDSYELGNFTFVHGHRAVPVRPVTVIGHEHPGITLRDEISATVKVPCFLYAEDLVVLPAMSIYATGTDVLKTEFASPILIKNRRDFEVFGIDEKLGVLPLGRLSSLQALSGGYPPLR